MAEEEKNNKPKATLIKHRKKPAEKPVIAEKESFKQEAEKTQEKKKVVVVKKKKVLVKKSSSAGKNTPKTISSKSEKEDIEKQKSNKTPPEDKTKIHTAPTAETAAPADKSDESAFHKKRPQETQAPKKSYVSKTGSRPANRPQQNADTRRAGNFNRSSQSERPERRPERPARPARGSTPRGSTPGRPGSGSPANASRNRTQPNRPQGQGRPPRPGAPKTGRPGDKYPSPNRGKAPAAAGGKKPGPGTKTEIEDAGKAQRKSPKKTFKSKKHVDYQKKHEKVPERNFQIKKKNKKKTNPVPKQIDIMEVITVSELAKKMNLKASELISKLMGMGMMVTINQQIDSDTAEIIAGEYGCTVNIVSLYDETIIETEKDPDQELKSRPPIVTVMGHVDHGKTKLLDAIRSSDVVAGEYGGITQHIGASTVKLPQGDIVFLDTPGHSAFTLMRSRGAQITDIVILVVAANDGVMPQTVEAINHAKDANVPIIVAINKVDLPEANPDRVKQQLSEYNLLPEDWGGSTLFCEISALKNQGIEELLETILLQSEILELTSNYNCRAEGKIIESKVEHGRGIVSTVIVQRGTLRVGDPFVAGIYSGKVRALFNYRGNKIDEATPSTPVEILGFSGGIPSAGAPFQVTENERQSRQVASKRQELERQGEASNMKKVTLDNLFDSIQEGEIQEFKVVIKGDVHGSVEALQTALEKLSTKEIRLHVIHASAGAIVENDINLAIASNAIVIGFNVRPTPKAQALAEKEKIDIRKYNIIYDVVDDIKLAMEGMLSPDYKENIIGHVEIRDIIKVPKIGLIAGSYVLDGKVKRNSMVHVLRDNVLIHTGKINSLKRFKDDVKTVDAGYECGLGIENFQDIRENDILEVYETVEVKKKL